MRYAQGVMFRIRANSPQEATKKLYDILDAASKHEDVAGYSIDEGWPENLDGEPCDECGQDIPNETEGMLNMFHAESCSLYSKEEL